jgi:hypothetical protein
MNNDQIVKIKIRTRIINKFGVFIENPIEMSGEEYSVVINEYKNYWNSTDSLRIFTNEGVVILPPNILAESIIVIEKI